MTNNIVSMHTNAGCTIAGSGQSGVLDTSDCNEADNDNSGCGSTLINASTPFNYGDGLNSIGGGVYATEWTSDYVKTWWFPRTAIPASITSGVPNVNDFGEPAVNAEGDPCPFDSHFANHSIIINIDFCGAYAGYTYSGYAQCPQSPNASYAMSSAQNSLDSCVNFVGLNPSYFTDAYWEINSIKVYQMPQGAQPSQSYSTSLSSVKPASTIPNSINPGQGGSTAVTSAAYSGPVSTGSVSVASAVPTPAICPGYNNSVWTDYNNQQYTIGCGSDYNGGSGDLSVYGATSFENCLEQCDTLNSCVGAAFVGGNGAGTCYPKAFKGAFMYNGASNGAARIAGAVSLPASASAATSTSVSASSARQTSAPARFSASTTSTSSSITPASSAIATSASTSVAPVSTPTVYPFSCPADNGTFITDPQGVQYMIGCGYDTEDTEYTTESAGVGFNDCFYACDESVTNSGVGYCSAWTYSGQTNGLGAGTCYLKNGANEAFKGPFYAAQVAAIRLYPPGVSPTPIPSSSSSTIVSTAASSSSSTSSAPSCPSANNTVITDPSGIQYTIHCGSDSTVGASSTSGVTGDFNQCFSICDKATGCVAFTFYPYVDANGVPKGTGICYLKNYYGPLTPVGGDVYAARITASAIAFSSTTSKTSVVSSYGVVAPHSTSSSTHATPVASTSSVVVIVAPSTTGTSSLQQALMTSPASSTTSLTSCPTTACSATATNGSTCADAYGNAFNVTCSVEYTGVVTVRAAKPNIGACLTSCDTTQGCIAVNYIGGVCSLLSSVTGNMTVPGDGAAAASRPADVSTIFTTPPAATSSSTFPTLFYSNTSTPPGLGSTLAVTSSNTLDTPPAVSGTTTGSVSSASACPSNPSSICTSPTVKQSCTDGNGAVYYVECGEALEGTPIVFSNSQKRATESSFQACLNLCDTTPHCVGLNYANNACGLFSTISDIVSSPGSVAAILQVSSSGTSSSAGPYPTGSGSPTCPLTDGDTTFTDSAGAQYTLGCYTDFGGGDIGAPYTAANFAACLPTCDATAGCLGVEYNSYASLCQLKSVFNSNQQNGNTSIIYGSRSAGAAPRNSVVSGTTTLCESSQTIRILIIC